jgi:hypothetical protein
MDRPRTENLGEDSRRSAEELLSLVKQRTGKGLPQLTESPALRVSRCPGARAARGSRCAGGRGARLQARGRANARPGAQGALRRGRPGPRRPGPPAAGASPSAITRSRRHPGSTLAAQHPAPGSSRASRPLRHTQRPAPGAAALPPAPAPRLRRAASHNRLHLHFLPPRQELKRLEAQAANQAVASDPAALKQLQAQIEEARRALETERARNEALVSAQQKLRSEAEVRVTGSLGGVVDGVSVVVAAGAPLRQLEQLRSEAQGAGASRLCPGCPRAAAAAASCPHPPTHAPAHALQLPQHTPSNPRPHPRLAPPRCASWSAPPPPSRCAPGRPWGQAGRRPTARRCCAGARRCCPGPGRRRPWPWARRSRPRAR